MLHFISATLAMIYVLLQPGSAQGSGKVYELSLDSQKLDVSEMRYLIETDSEPIDLKRYSPAAPWTSIPKQKRFYREEVQGKRVIMEFDLKAESDTIYLNYVWAPPLKFQKFIVLDQNDQEIPVEIVRDVMLLVSARLVKGQYRVLFIAEPFRFSDLKSNIFLMNSSFVSAGYMDESRFYLYVFGIGSAFVFFNFTMFLLHRRFILSTMSAIP